jgi:hypothetical protein
MDLTLGELQENLLLGARPGPAEGLFESSSSGTCIQAIINPLSPPAEDEGTSCKKVYTN